MPALPHSTVRSAWPLLLCGALLPLVLFWGMGQGLRGTQLWLLSLPAWLWLWFPLAQSRARLVQLVACGAVLAIAQLDALVRALILHNYQATPDSSLVLAALANTNSSESAEYLAMNSQTLLLWAGALLLGWGVLAVCLYRWWQQPPALARLRAWARWQQALLALLILLVAASWMSKPMRRHHPLLFWPEWVVKVDQLRAQWGNLQASRQQLLLRAEHAQPRLAAGAPDTLMLVITDSITRDNVNLYGYARDTMPHLGARLAERGTLFRHAWSSDAATVPALRNLFRFGAPDSDDSQHLLALARAAGYQVWWIGNHNDLAIEQEHAHMAQHVVLTNNQPGRSGGAPDGVVLPKVEQALNAPAARKLIVVHLLGAHPHYRLRTPDGFAPFGQNEDSVIRNMDAEGRSALAILRRNEYDNAIRYQDQVLAGLLSKLERQPGRSTMVFLSDHGQEVGHVSDRSGHSPGTAQGYRIPLALWHSDAPPYKRQLTQPVRSDWLGFSIASLLGLRWDGYQPTRNALNPDYRWQPLNLPLAVNYRS